MRMPPRMRCRRHSSCLRKAATLPRPDGLASWLYAVAQRIAFKARRVDHRLRRCAAVAEPSDPSADPLAALTARELVVILEEELQRLPASHRMAVVACCLEGHSREEAAALLGCTTGALRGWLERGRARLHARLLKRGVTLSAALAAAEAARGGVDAALWAKAVSAALGGALADVVRLGGGGTLMRLPLLLVAVVVLGGAAIGFMTTTEPPRDGPQPVQPQPTAAPAHVDALGDPLPPEAVARIGSTRLRPGSSIRGLTYANAGKTIVSVAMEPTDAGPVQLWDAATGKLRYTGPAKSDAVYACVASADSKTVHILGDKTYVLLDAGSGKVLRRRACPRMSLPCSTRSPPMAPYWCAAGRTSGSACSIWQAGRRGRGLKADGMGDSIALTTDRKTLAIGGETGLIRLFDMPSGQSRGKMQMPPSGAGRPEPVGHLQFSPDGGTLLASRRDSIRDNSVILWDVETCEERSRIQGLGRWHCAWCSAYPRWPACRCRQQLGVRRSL